MKNKKIFIIIIMLIFIVSAFIIFEKVQDNNTTITQLSPKGSRQMMGYIIKTKKGKLIVIDGGTTNDTQNLMNYISQNENKVDYWFITHAHDDHAGAFTQIATNENITVNNIYVSLNDLEWYEKNEPQRAEFSKLLIDTINDEKIKKQVKSPKINEKIQIDELEVEILGIKNPEITENVGNEQSMVIKFNTGKTTFLILGDTGKQSSKKLLTNQKEKLKSDIVQMSHHGQDGATKELYEQIQPKICLWPTPEWLWNNNAGEGQNTRTLENFRNKRMDKNIKSKRKLYSKRWRHYYKNKIKVLEG